MMTAGGISQCRLRMACQLSSRTETTGLTASGRWPGKRTVAPRQRSSAWGSLISLPKLPLPSEFFALEDGSCCGLRLPRSSP
jgi:hypothetical protein